jgi:signal peptidase I
VAIVVALGVRTFILQPFTIPTGSMQPTLNGIKAYPTEEPPPNVLVRGFQMAALGREWLNTMVEEDGIIADYEEVRKFRFMTYTNVYVTPTIQTADGARIVQDKDRVKTYQIHAPKSVVESGFNLFKGKEVRGGTPLVRGYIDTGDHVFVDKITYNFLPPSRGDVFVFNTQRLPTGDRSRERQRGDLPNDPAAFDLPEVAGYCDRMGRTVNMDSPSQFYIKRLVGTPGDELRIDPPYLFVNGRPAEGPEFARVMSAENGYQGYALGMPTFLMPILRTKVDTYKIPSKHYFGMGDNSYHSSDSRDWGPVPERNIVGRAIFVYWPFVPHWGRIK